jgi:hypothetical protein
VEPGSIPGAARTSDVDSSRPSLSDPRSGVRPACDGVKRITDLPAPRMLSVPPPHGGCMDAPAPSRERGARGRVAPRPTGSPGLLEHVRLVTLRQLFENVGMYVHGCLHVAGASVRPRTQAVCAFRHTTRVIYGTPGWGTRPSASPGETGGLEAPGISDHPDPSVQSWTFGRLDATDLLAAQPCLDVAGRVWLRKGGATVAQSCDGSCVGRCGRKPDPGLTSGCSGRTFVHREVAK